MPENIPFSSFPNELRYSIIQQLEAKTSIKLLRVSQATRQLILLKGPLPKRIVDITVYTRTLRDNRLVFYFEIQWQSKDFSCLAGVQFSTLKDGCKVRMSDEPHGFKLPQPRGQRPPTIKTSVPWIWMDFAKSYRNLKLELGAVDPMGTIEDDTRWNLEQLEKKLANLQHIQGFRLISSDLVAKSILPNFTSSITGVCSFGQTPHWDLLKEDQYKDCQVVVLKQLNEQNWQHFARLNIKLLIIEPNNVDSGKEALKLLMHKGVPSKSYQATLIFYFSGETGANLALMMTYVNNLTADFQKLETKDPRFLTIKDLHDQIDGLPKSLIPISSRMLWDGLVDPGNHVDFSIRSISGEMNCAYLAKRLHEERPFRYTDYVQFVMRNYSKS